MPYTQSRIIFHMKGKEDVLLEALVGSEGETVKVSYRMGGIPFYRGFLYETAKKHLVAGDWVIISQQSLVA